MVRRESCILLAGESPVRTSLRDIRQQAPKVKRDFHF